MSVRVSATVAASLVLLAGCGAEPDGAAAPSTSPTAQALGDEVAFELLGVQQAVPEMGTVSHAVGEDGYREEWERLGFEGERPHLDLEQHVVVFLTRAEDACPDEVAGVALDGDRLVVDWQPPPGGCNQPLIPTGFALALHRSTVPATFAVVLEGFHDEYDDVVHEVALEPYDGSGPKASTSQAEPAAPSEVTGVVERPAAGGAAVGRLDDGTPVWVVAHPDGTTSVLATDMPVSMEGDGPSLDGLRSQVVLLPDDRFSGGGRFDLRGVSVQGRAATNLHRYELAVDGDQVTVGRRLGPVPGEATGGADVDDEPGQGAGGFSADAVVFPDDPGSVKPLSLDEALQQPSGRVVVVDASVVVYGDDPVRICDAPQPPAFWDWDGCPDDAPSPAGVTRLDDRALRYVWHGPLRVRVIDGELHDVTLLGGGATGGVIDR